MIDTVEQQVLLNAQARFTPAGTIRMPNFISHGGAIIGKVRPSNIPTLIFGHEDAITNKNIIIGYTLGIETNEPRIITSLPGNTLTDSRTNHTYIGTPVFSGSFNFTQSDQLRTATNTSKTSYSGGVYNSYFPSSYSQFKIVHGVNYQLAPNTSFLSSKQNPYDTGLGLELESRSLYIDYGNPGGGYNNIARTPIVLGRTGTQIKGNRSLLVTKSSITTTNDITTYLPVILFEIAPTNHVSVGKAIVFPLKSVNVGSTSLKSATPTVGAADTTVSISSTPSSLTSTNAGRWADISQGTSVLTPDTSRSLLISRISVGSRPSGNMLDLDQSALDIQAGITIDLGSQIIGAVGDSLSSLLSVYKNLITPNSASITSSNIAYSAKSGNSAYGLLSGAPLGIKPGYIVHDDAGTGPQSRFLKGVDSFIEGGDLFYSGSQYPYDGMAAGDVYLSGGQIYKEFLGVSGSISGFGSPISDFNYPNFGNVYLATRLTSWSGASYTAPGPSRAGNVYVGYSSDVPGNFQTNVFRPIGNALLNVSAPTQSVESSSVPTDAGAAGRAINIQRGDIVTNNQDAGWIEFDLGQTALRSAGTGGASVGGVFSNAINYYSGASGVGTVAASYMNTGLPDLLSNWKFYYKVIGYTVHFRLFMANLNFRTARQITGSYNAANWSDFFEIANPAIFTGGGSMTGRIPKPKTKDAYQWYNNSDFDHTASASFYGTGTLYLRNRNISGSRISDYIMGSNNPGDNAILLKKPVAMFYDPEFERFYFKRTGVATLGDYVTINANIGGAPFLGISVGNPVTNVYASFAYQQHLTRFLIDSTGQPFMPISNASSYNWNSYMTYDLIVSGTYELDPASWFV
jgi:hypothetical protein